jgi:hypothetical protein
MKKSSGNRPQEPSTEEDRQATFERRRAVMQMFCDNAKTYIQLSLGALALTLTFTDRILHIPQTANIADGWMITVWACFLVTVVAGAFYQYLAVKLVEANVEWGYNDAWDWLQPGYVYAVMLVAFYGGTIIFTIYAIIRLRHP